MMATSKFPVDNPSTDYPRTWSSVILLVILSFLFAGTATAQPKTKTGAKVGLELGEYLSANSGSFQKEPGFAVGLFTGIDILADVKSALSLGLELNFKKMIQYRPGHEVFSATERGLYRLELDERFAVSYVDAGMFPTFLYSLNDQMMFGLYVGPSIGIGKEDLVFHERSRTAIDTLYHPSVDGLYSEYGKGLARMTSVAIGMSCWYGSFVFQVRYETTHVSESKIDNFKTLYIEVGLAF